MSKSKTRIKAVLFDLGKVIVQFNFDPAFKRLSRASGVPAKEIEDFFVNTGLEVLYDGGKISSKEFYLEIKKGLGHNVPFEQFKKIWNEIFTPNKPVVQLIRRLHGKVRLVLISNTNQMHFEYICKRYKILKKFDVLLVSYKEKMRKPDDRFYKKAARACQAKPAQILYVDDRSDLTEAAKKLGFHVFTYKNNFPELQSKLNSLGVL